jgi:Tfp pilus assembly protein PilN
MSESLNLARRPFINTRPVARVSLLLWVLGLLLLLGNVSLYWNYLAGSGEKRSDLDRLETKIQQQERKNGELERRLASLDLAQQNRQVRYLNQKIAERTFAWSTLFDELAKVMPDQVRLTSLSPSAISQEDERRFDEEEGAGPRQTRVQLIIHGESKSDEAFFQFVDRLFEPPFEDPDFSRKSREEGDLVKFDLRVTYIPDEPQSAQGIVIEEQEPVSPALPTPGMPAPPQPAPPASGRGTIGSEIDG